MNCEQTYGTACRCKRLSGTCVKCRREVTVSAGERATPALAHDRGRLIGYRCVRCR
jgi:hypothetical protein